MLKSSTACLVTSVRFFFLLDPCTHEYTHTTVTLFLPEPSYLPFLSLALFFCLYLLLLSLSVLLPMIVDLSFVKLCLPFWNFPRNFPAYITCFLALNHSLNLITSTICDDTLPIQFTTNPRHRYWHTSALLYRYYYYYY